jgi:hypothetical protein
MRRLSEQIPRQSRDLLNLQPLLEMALKLALVDLIQIVARLRSRFSPFLRYSRGPSIFIPPYAPDAHERLILHGKDVRSVDASLFMYS